MQILWKICSLSIFCDLFLDKPQREKSIKQNLKMHCIIEYYFIGNVLEIKYVFEIYSSFPTAICQAIGRMHQTKTCGDKRLFLSSEEK